MRKSASEGADEGSLENNVDPLFCVREEEWKFMHEMSIVAGVLDSVVPAAKEAGALKVTGVTLRIGDMTDVVDEALTFAFEALTEGTICEGAELIVEPVHPRSMCLECGNEFDHDRFHRSCTACGSFETKPIRGRELEIASIEVDLPDDEDN